MVKTLRGAITVEENSSESIRWASCRLIDELLRRNRLRPSRILCFLFSLTRDLDRLNPAQVARELGFTATALFCVQEAKIAETLPRVIRVLIIYTGPKWRKAVPVYLGKAGELRPDLAGGMLSDLEGEPPLDLADGLHRGQAGGLHRDQAGESKG
jgi:monofunctional chorismate mutase